MNGYPMLLRKLEGMLGFGLRWPHLMGGLALASLLTVLIFSRSTPAAAPMQQTARPVLQASTASPESMAQSYLSALQRGNFGEA